MNGRIHSIETMGALDGPGLRAVAFLQGCALRCRFCHNPDTWHPVAGEEISAEKLVARLARYKPYFRNVGGVTLSGGEPLLQARFAAEVLAGCKRQNIHTALDTSGTIWNQQVEEALAYTDMLLLDIKHTDADRHRELTGANLAPVLYFLDQATRLEIPTWIRTVVVPGWNDSRADMGRLAAMLRNRGNIERIEMLPYHSMANRKYREMGMRPPLENIPDFPIERLSALAETLRGHLGESLPVVCPDAPALPASSESDMQKV